MSVTVIGAGLSGCEAAYAAASAGADVELIEMKPLARSAAHRSDAFGELVCSNSLKAKRLDSAAGLLKEEMCRLGSVCMRAAETCAVPAGGALAVDRDAFSQYLTNVVASNPRIRVHTRRQTEIPRRGVVVVATGPLTDGALADDLRRLCGTDYLSFYDAAAPIVSGDSIDYKTAFFAARYDQAQQDYVNCPMDKDTYLAFHAALTSAQIAPRHAVDGPVEVYEGCMPIETLAARGLDAIRYGPLKPVGLRDPRTGRRPWAVVQLRKENLAGTAYNMVGFQTNLRFGEQQRVFRMIPGLEQAEFLRYGVMHRNSFICSPRLLRADYSLRAHPGIFIAGQLSGVEGYMESAASGILAGLNAARRLQNQPPLLLPPFTMIGALAAYISNPAVADFQPMGANFGILPPLPQQVRDKRARYAAFSERSLRWLSQRLEGTI